VQTSSEVDHADEVTLFSAHDPWEFGRLAS
jgi:hypothetical protein